MTDINTTKTIITLFSNESMQAHYLKTNQVSQAQATISGEDRVKLARLLDEDEKGGVKSGKKNPVYLTVRGPNGKEAEMVFTSGFFGSRQKDELGRELVTYLAKNAGQIPVEVLGISRDSEASEASAEMEDCPV